MANYTMHHLNVGSDTYEMVDEQGRANIAPSFSTSTTYVAGDYVIYGGKLYQFTTAHAGAWTGADAEECTVAEDISQLKEDFGNVISDTMDVSVSGSYVNFEPFFGKKLFGSGCMFSGSGATYDIDISDLDLVGKTISVFMWLDDMTSYIDGNITEVQLDANNQQIYPSSGYHYVGHPMKILSNCKKIRLYASQNAYSSWSSSTIQHIQLSESGSAQVEYIRSYSVRGMVREEELNKLEDNVIGYNPHYSYTIVKDEYVKTNGAIESYPTWDRTDYIPLVGTVLYVTIENSGNPYNCLYDANKNFISNFQTVTAGTATIELPPSAKYVVLSAGAGEKWVLTANMPDSLTELDTRVSNLEAQTIINGWSGKKWVSYGDSITQGNTWQPIVASKFGLVHINKGVGGSSVADGQINGVVSMCNAERIAELPSDADIITIMGGTNDYNLTNEGKGTPLGDFPISSASYDTFTFYGAYLAMLQRIQQQCPNALIVVMSCINSRGVTGQNETYCYQNQLGLSTPDYSSAAEAVARYTGSAFLDMEKCGITLFNRAKYITDTVHPNAEGGKLMARMVISYLQTHQPN